MYKRDYTPAKFRYTEDCEDKRAPGCYFPANECRFGNVVLVGRGMGYVDNVAFAVDVKSVQKCTNAGLYTSNDRCQKNKLVFHIMTNILYPSDELYVTKTDTSSLREGFKEIS
ncbi:hypothetical protein RF11_05354 [Thelohanellus kitauei]|uniref:Uncharacterized protein n=1 Tax=Thelohanellus kitauei TaxID=669202 RepID=A0A0C2JVS2_THEKT|nr:hypothetical protein RF11_05354 [Thelohanellus kitauei]